MQTEIIKAHKTLIKTIIENQPDGYKLQLINGTWDNELPKEYKDAKAIVLDINNWTLEQSYLTDEGISITTAFGKDECTKNFKYDDIINIISLDGKIVYYQKSFMYKELEAVQISEEYSMLKMLERNSHLKKYQ